MKGLKKVLLMILISILCYSMYSCTKTGPIELSTPSNFKLEGRVLYWDEVENAIGYSLIFLDKEYETEEEYYDLSEITEPDTYNIEILAVGDGNNYSDSKWSNYSYTCERIVSSGYDEERFAFYLLDDGSGYELDRGFGFLLNDDFVGTLVLPSFYHGLPVKGICKEAFVVYTKMVAPSVENFSNINYTVTDIIFPAKLEYIEMCAFECFQRIESLTFPDSLKYIGERAFNGCINLKHVKLPRELTYIGNSAFATCALEELVLPDKLEIIENYAFCSFDNTNSSLLHTTFVAKLFKVKKIVFPDSVKMIGANAFSGMESLEEIILPKKLSVLGFRAFYKCTNLSKIELCEYDEDTVINSSIFMDTAWYSSHDDGFIYYDKNNTIIGSYKSTTDEDLKITIPSNVKLAKYCFSDLENLKEIYISEGVELGDYLFEGCTGLESVSLPSDLKETSMSMFEGCTSLTNITLPEGLEVIGDYSFYKSGVSNITIPNSVTTIGTLSFAYTQIKSINIPSSVKTINSRAFANSSLEAVIIPKNVEVLGDHIFDSCKSLVSLTLLANSTILPTGICSSCTSLKEVILNDSILTIESNAFSYCTSLETITLPKNLTKIDGFVFINCVALNDIIIPKSVTSLSENICYGWNVNTIYYEGSSEQWNKLLKNNDITEEDNVFGNASIYTYQENAPAASGVYWHYVDGVATIWKYV